ncbi:MAG: PucR family transcriptional regulator, partial [Actinocrinis sp.]
LLPDDLRDAQRANASRASIRAFLRLLQGAHPDEASRAQFQRRAAERAAEGVPLPVLLRTYTIGARVVFEALCREARPDESGALAEIAQVLLAGQDEVIADVARAYRDELAALGSARRDRRRELVRDLVVGSAAPDPAAIEEFRLGAGAIVLAVRLGPLDPPQEGVDQPVPKVAGALDDGAADRDEAQISIRRRLLRFQAALDGHYGRPVPALLEHSGGHVLIPRLGAVPVAGCVPQSPHTPVPGAQLAALLSEVWEGQVRIAAVGADRPDRIGAAARTASEVLRLVCVLRRGPGVYELDDVLLEYHLTRRDESADRLGALLDPLAGRPDLLRTVRVFLEESYDRRRTARRLGLHPNTVDNRLARVTELTGLDPATPRGVALLMTTLALHDLQ